MSSTERFWKAGLSALALSLLLAGTAHAQLVAGWDFSQYTFDGFLIPDGATPSGTLDANYSDQDPSFGAGSGSAAFGTMYLDGTFGSTTSPLDGVSDPFVPTAAARGSLRSNLDAPGLGRFDRFPVLRQEGQPTADFRAMTAAGAATVVFEADLSSVPETGERWHLSFGGRTFTGTASVGIGFSTDGGSFGSVETVQLTDTDTKYEVPLSAAASEKAYVRMSFAAPGAQGANQAIIDNVAIAINVPEPGAASAGLAACVALLGLSRLHERRESASYRRARAVRRSRTKSTS